MSDGVWVQWVLGAWITLSTAVGLHIYSRLEAIRKEAEMQSETQMRRLESQLENLRTDILTERRLAAQDRQGIAEKMVTRGELDRQVDRVMGEIGKIRGTGGGWTRDRRDSGA